MDAKGMIAIKRLMLHSNYKIGLDTRPDAEKVIATKRLKVLQLFSEFSSIPALGGGVEPVLAEV